MQSRSKWFLGAGVLAIVLGGVLFLWALSNSASVRSLWHGHGATVLQFAVPPVLALLGWTAQQLITSRSERSTPEQLVQARLALAGRGLEWWRGVPEPAWPGHVLRAGLRPLDVTWARPVTAGQAADLDPVYGRTSDIAGLAARFKVAGPGRLVISGPPGSGKSVLARLLMAELLADRQPGDPVPVFLPLWSWDPEAERLRDWMTRRIADTYPELQEEAAYGPTAVAALVDQGLVLPILDGLDALPERCRRAVLNDGELMSQERLILTCRSDELAGTDGFMLIAPRPVDLGEALRFLTEVTVRPAEWREVEAHIAAHEDCPLTEVLTDPRFIYLASIVYQKSGNKPGQPAACDPRELINDDDLAGPDVRNQVLTKVVPALLPPGGEWARDFPWYSYHAAEWLGSLTRLDLRDPDPADRSGPAWPADPGSSRIAWWNLHRGVGWLDRHQARVRALVAGLLSFGIVTLVFRTHHDRDWRYSLMTAGSYASMICVACAFLGGAAAKRPGTVAAPTSGRAAFLWWLRASWARWWPVVTAAFITFACVGTLLGLRVALGPVAAHVGTPGEVGRRVGVYNGLTHALLIVIAFFVAGVPAAPRTVRSADFGRRRQAELGRFATAIALGIPFGVLWGATAVLKHQHGLVVSRLHGHVHIISMPPSHQQVIITGLITGIDFVLGAWLFHWSAPWFQPRRPATPRPAARADLAGALLRPFILGFTFAFAFGISAPFNFTGVDVAAWFVVGTVLGTLGTEWPLYLTAISWLALRRKELPLRLLRFLDCCRACGILRVIHHEYQIHDAALLAGAEPAAREPAAGPQRGLRIDVPRQTSGLVAAAGHPMSDDGQG